MPYGGKPAMLRGHPSWQHPTRIPKGQPQQQQRFRRRGTAAAATANGQDEDVNKGASHCGAVAQHTHHARHATAAWRLRRRGGGGYWDLCTVRMSLQRSHRIEQCSTFPPQLLRRPLSLRVTSIRVRLRASDDAQCATCKAVSFADAVSPAKRLHPWMRLGYVRWAKAATIPGRLAPHVIPLRYSGIARAVRS